VEKKRANQIYTGKGEKKAKQGALDVFPDSV